MSPESSTRQGVRLPSPAEPLQALERWPEGGSEREGYVPLDRNERPSPLPDWFVEKIRAAVSSDTLVNYPATDRFHANLAASLDLSPERVLVTPGADPVFKSLYQVYASSGQSVVMLDPSYAMYAVYARMFGANAIGIPYDRELNLDADRLLAEIVPGVSLVLIANPNQPTGTLMSEDLLVSVLERAGQAGALLVVDEAYHIFCGESALPLLDDWANLLVVRSWSKAGFAGARLGFVAGDPEVVGNLFKVRSAAEVGSFAALCGSLLLEHPEIEADFAAEVAAGAELLSEHARQLGLEPLPTKTNFLQIRLPEGQDPAAVVAALRERKWLIKAGFQTPGLVDCIRVTLGPPDLMERFAGELRDVLAG